MIKIDKQLIDKVCVEAENCERRRKNYNFHEFSDPIQRMLNAMQPDTYLRPHKHEDPDKREVFILLQGKIAVLEFDNDGNIIDSIILSPQTGNHAVEIIPRSWHSIVVLSPDSVIYEIKDGPYEPLSDKNFAPWSPREGSKEIAEYLEKLRHLIIDNHL